MFLGGLPHKIFFITSFLKVFCEISGKAEKKWKNIFGSKNIFPSDVEKDFWMQKSEVEKYFWTTSDGKIFLDYKSYKEKKNDV